MVGIGNADLNVSSWGWSDDIRLFRVYVRGELVGIVGVKDYEDTIEVLIRAAGAFSPGPNTEAAVEAYNDRRGMNVTPQC